MLDNLDRKLLVLLQADSKQPVAQLAETVGLSASACAKRIAKMWSEGVILRQVVKLDRKLFRQPVTAAVMVTLSRPNSATSDQFDRTVSQYPNVLQCHSITGDFDKLLIVCERSIEDYHEFAQSTFGSMDTVEAYKSSFILKTTKNEDVVLDFSLEP